MNRRRLLGISCALIALAFVLAPAASPVRAQLLPPPPPAPAVNLAPVVNAGADQVITLPSIANLTGVAIDDGQPNPPRSEEHTSELQSHHDLVCRLLLEKK